jgi:hypothetical protein
MGRSPTRLRQYIAAGRLPYTTDQRGWRRFNPADVDHLAAEVDRYKLKDQVEETPTPVGSAPQPQPTDEQTADQPDLQDLVAGFLRTSAVHARQTTTTFEDQPQ